MKATIEVPDELYRRVKARSALLGKAVREVTVELYERWVDGSLDAPEDGKTNEWLDEWFAEADRAAALAPADGSARVELERARQRLDHP
jgi:hypothetical protein